MTAPSTVENYRRARSQIQALLAEANDPVAAMASVAAVLYHSLKEVSWVGFYRAVDSKRLRVGPYQGPVGCLEIDIGTGVCGVAAAERQTQIVPDVHTFEGHIACDPRSRSEIVIPVFGPEGHVEAVLDLDSHQPARFDEMDRVELEAIAAMLERFFASQSSRPAGSVGSRHGRRPTAQDRS